MSGARGHEPEFGSERERELADWLEQAGAEQRSVLSQAAELDDAPGLDRVAATLEAARARENAARRRRFLVSAAVAASVLLAVVIGLRRGDDPGPEPGPTGVFLSSGALEIVTPGEDQTGWNAIEWTGPEGASFSLLVLNAEGSEVLFEREGLRTTRVELDEAQAWGLVVIVVEVHDETGRVIDSVERVARRSP